MPSFNEIFRNLTELDFDLDTAVAPLVAPAPSISNYGFDSGLNLVFYALLSSKNS